MLDIKSVLLQSAITHGFFALILIVFNFKKTEIKGTKKLGRGFLYLFIGLTIFVSRGKFNYLIMLLIANFLMMLGLMEVSQGIREFKSYNEKLFYLEKLALIPLTLLFVYFIYFNPNVNARIIIFALFTIYTKYKIVAAINHEYNQLITYINSLINFFVISSIIFEIYRIISAIFGNNLDSFYKAGTHEGIRLMVLQLDHFMLMTGVFLISNKINENELKKQSMIDSLTNIFNRKAFDKLALMRLDEARRTKESFALIICDIDFFKKINDSFGHLAGDEVIKKIVNILKDNLRTSDVLGRFGGEEFVFVIPKIEKVDLMEKLEDIREKIEKSSIVIDNNLINVTASFGGVICNPGENDLKNLFNMSDKALYEAKENGRNKVVLKDNFNYSKLECAGIEFS